MIKWSLQNDFICIPRSSKKERIVENFDVFNFKITEGDIKALVSESRGKANSFLFTIYAEQTR